MMADTIYGRILASIPLFLCTAAGTVSLFSSGAPAGRTGAPGDLGTCNTSGCHNSFLTNSGVGSITISGPSQYSPGETLEFSVRVEEDGATKFGFEITAKDLVETNVGTWDVSDPSIQNADGNPDYVTHQPAQSAINEYTWNVRWTAPASDIGEIRIYGAGNAANGNNNAKGDRIYSTNRVLSPSASTTTSREEFDFPSGLRIVSVFPNPFVTRTTVSYSIDAVTDVSIELFDMVGRRVGLKSIGSQTPGMHELLFHADDLPSGVLIFRLRAGSASRTGKLLISR